MGGIDQLDGGNGNDELLGGAGRDTLTGGNGNDELDGGAGDGRLFGGNGNDLLIGGLGDDVFQGDNGNDRYTGGAGADMILLGRSFHGNDVGTDFDTGADTIQLENGVSLRSSRVVDVNRDGVLDLKLTFTRKSGSLTLLGVSDIDEVTFEGGGNDGPAAASLTATDSVLI